MAIESTLLWGVLSRDGNYYHVAVAQWIERFPAEEEVGGSNPLSNAFFIFGFSKRVWREYLDMFFQESPGFSQVLRLWRRLT